ncbi:GntR family transcriptional regulator [Paralimibaculum aggregatum]|uniref:GntR family transcriptional regulator n=1 Tax=Paralimibaculum aggregatum TaxID=3036245 RepID=A0ABQ6LEF1_9RHOB|nr:GntR family transcriptional regulator [Limibaculum sp. NKW23]GMG81735.1 GntR family transcriptional regulator [Limibaculum sp. NKW23]
MTDTATPIAAIDRRPLAAELTDRLRVLIIEGTLPPEAKLSEQALCARFAVSRTPLREALRSLAAEGLVVMRPGRGAAVAPLTLAELDELFPVIGVLEGLAGELAARNITDAGIARLRMLQAELVAQHRAGDLPGYLRTNAEIHAAIREAAGNATLSASIAHLDAKLRRARCLANLSPERWAEAVEEHALILDALAARDGARLAAVLRRHLANKGAALTRQFRARGVN